MVRESCTTRRYIDKAGSKKALSTAVICQMEEEYVVEGERDRKGDKGGGGYVLE